MGAKRVGTKEKRILLVDDDKNIYYSLQMIFEGKPYIVDYVENCNAAVKMIKKAAYDLILMDIMLPRKSGILCMDNIRKIRPQMHIMFLTAVNHVQACREAFLKGACDYLTKPFPPDDLLKRVEDIFKAESKSVVA
ncbi:MAG: response regulator [Nitrospira sp.]|nr:response regulator [Nitrospira sp.]